MTRLNLEIKIRIIILMVKLESVTLARRAIKQEKLKDMFFIYVKDTHYFFTCTVPGICYE